MREQFALDPSITFLNHGSFGACPRAVLEHQSELRARLEAEPVRFFVRELEPLAAEARARVAEFVGAKSDDVAFVANATTGVNCVLRSLVFSPGDELLTTSHAYNACVNVLRFVAERAGAAVKVVTLPFPFRATDSFDDLVLNAVTPRTKLVLLDEVTSPSALVFDLRRLVRTLEDRGVMVLVDAAHSPGMVPMAIDEVGASFTTANLHKWVCAPKGAAFLHVRRDRQPLVRPLVISHGANSPRTDRSRFRLEFDWQGTNDPTAALSVPKALDTVGAMHEGGWPGVRKANHDLVMRGRQLVLAAVKTEPLAPEANLGSMAAIALPGPATPNPQTPDPLQRVLFDEHRIEVPVIGIGGVRCLRLSAHRHNTIEDYERLSATLADLAVTVGSGT